MPGLFDGMRISRSGLQAHRILQEVVAQNLANASNENYSRQDVRTASAGSVWDKTNFMGSGVEVNQIVRIRDTLLDKRVRESMGSSHQYEVETKWLEKVQAAFNEPSDHGVNAALTDFWNAWSQLADDPEKLGSRSNVLSKTGHLSTQLNLLDQKLGNLEDDIHSDLNAVIGQINKLVDQIAHLNKDIFDIEMGGLQQANDLRDNRDAVLDELAQKVSIRTHEAANGMVNVFVAGHIAVNGDHHESLTVRADTLDPSKAMLVWEFGERFGTATSGQLAGVISVRDTILPGIREQVNDFATSLIEQVNTIYSKGVAQDGHIVLDSGLGYEALGVQDASDSLDLLATGQTGAMHVSFYDSSRDVVRQAAVLIHASDSLQDIADKLNKIKGIEVSLLSDTNEDGRLRIQLDTLSGDNALGETSFAVSNNTGGHDTSHILELLGFDQTAKSTNTSATTPELVSRDLTELQTVLGVSNLTEVRAAELGLSGRFTINTFETYSEEPPKTNGHHMEQFAIEVESSDSIDSIIAKINNLTANFGIAASVNGLTNKIELSTSAETDADGNITLTGGTHTLRLSFANAYRYPEVADDEPPSGYNGNGDTLGLLPSLQYNTLFSGSDAGDIAIDSRISGAAKLNAGLQLKSGDNGVALALAGLQHQRVISGNQYTIGEDYQRLVSAMGAEVAQSENLYQNETVLMDNFINEKLSISGVNIDEELANMIQFQRAFDANARMLSTFNQMAQELLRLTGV